MTRVPRTRAPRIAFVGEAWGADEEAASALAGVPMPFVGGAGRLFNTLLAGIGIKRTVVQVGRRTEIDQPDNVLVTNVFNRRPERNEIKRLFVPKKAGDLDWPALERGRYLDPALRPELDRLFAELTRFKPGVIVTLGTTPLWALCKATGILTRRGCLHDWRGIPVIPSIHPAFVLRKFTWFPLALADFHRALGVAAGSVLPERPVFTTRPTLAAVRQARAWAGPIVFDIETLPKLTAITCVGLGDGATGAALCVPFVDLAKPERNYWKTAAEEVEAWIAVRAVLENPKTVKVAQVASYDVTWLREIAGIEVSGPLWDTRTLHHALWPELPHSLGAIATSFPDLLFPPWKAAHAAAKRDD